MSGSRSEARVRVLYDRDCGFCRWSVAKLLQLDRACRLEPVAIQSERGSVLLGSLPEPDRLATAHAVTSDGKVHSGGDAAPVIASCLRRGRPVAAVTGALPRLTRAGYTMVANNRQSVGRFVSSDMRARADSLLAQRSLPDSR